MGCGTWISLWSVGPHGRAFGLQCIVSEKTRARVPEDGAGPGKGCHAEGVRYSANSFSRADLGFAPIEVLATSPLAKR